MTEARTAKHSPNSEAVPIHLARDGDMPTFVMDITDDPHYSSHCLYMNKKLIVSEYDCHINYVYPYYALSRSVNMLSQILSQYIDATPEEVRRWLALSPDEIHKDESYLALVGKVKTDLLSKTMTMTRGHLDGALPRLVDKYQAKNDLPHYLTSPATLPAMLNHHTTVSRDIMREVLPEILDEYKHVPQHASEWQRAFATIVIPLVTAGK